MRRSGLASAIAVAIALSLGACDPAPTTRGITSDTAARTSSAPRASTPAAASPSASASPTLRIVEGTSDTDALSLIRTARLAAKADDRVLVVYVGATWCQPCRSFKAELASRRLDDRLSKITLLTFDADKDVDRLGAAGYSFTFVPFIALPGPDGRPYDTAQATGKTADAWRELLAKLDSWQHPS